MLAFHSSQPWKKVATCWLAAAVTGTVAVPSASGMACTMASGWLK